MFALDSVISVDGSIKLGLVDSWGVEPVVELNLDVLVMLVNVAVSWVLGKPLFKRDLFHYRINGSSWMSGCGSSKTMLQRHATSTDTIKDGPSRCQHGSGLHRNSGTRTGSRFSVGPHIASASCGRGGLLHTACRCS